MVKKYAKFYGNMEWWNSSDQPNSFEEIPSEFKAAYELFQSNKQENMEKIISLLSPFIGARFIASNLSSYNELFKDEDDSGIIEIEAKSVNLVGIEFTEGCLPLCKSEATFEVPVKGKFFKVDLVGWQDENSYFSDAIVFYWNIPQPDEDNWIDLTSGEHSGAECVYLEE